MNKLSRRHFCQVASIVSAGAIAIPAANRIVNAQGSEENEILKIFNQLPGQKSIKIQTIKNNVQRDIALNPEISLFCGSSFKVYVLTEFLRQMEAGKVKLTDKLVVSDELRSLSSPVFAELSGETTALIALEAMMMHSDNTATDILMKYVTPQAVRTFIKDIGLQYTKIPDSTRIFFSYLVGADNGTDLGWQRVSEIIDSQQEILGRKIINEQQTMISTPSDFVSFYSRALQGEFFKKPQTLAEFKRILSLPAILTQFIPEGAFGYVKGGSINFPPQYALSIAGGVRFSNNHWAYYSFLINWEENNSQEIAKTQNLFLEAISQTLRSIVKF